MPVSPHIQGPFYFFIFLYIDIDMLICLCFLQFRSIITIHYYFKSHYYDWMSFKLIARITTLFKGVFIAVDSYTCTCHELYLLIQFCLLNLIYHHCYYNNFRWSGGDSKRRAAENQPWNQRSAKNTQALCDRCIHAVSGNNNNAGFLFVWSN